MGITVMTTMSKSLEDEILDILRKDKQPTEPSELFSKLLMKHLQKVDDSSIRNALWRLIATQKIELTPKLQLQFRNVTETPNHLSRNGNNHKDGQ